MALRDPFPPSRDPMPQRGTFLPYREALPSRLVFPPSRMPPNMMGLYVFQQAAVRWLREHSHAILAFEQRLGKTLASLRALPTGGRTIVICPLSLRLQWRDDVKRWRPDLTPRIVSAGESVVPGPREVVIVNYEGMPDPISRNALVAGNLRDVYVIVDEAHLLSNVDTMRSEKVRALVLQCRAAWALTGTPMPGTPMHIWGLLYALNLHRRAFGSFKKFLAIFGGKKKRGAYEFKTNGPDGLDLSPARDALAKVMLRKRRREVYPEMPSKNYKVIPVEIVASDVIENAEREWKLLGATTLPPQHELSEARRELAEAKINAMLEEVGRHEDAGLPLLVFSAHRAPVDALSRRQGWAIINGDTNPKERHELVSRFQAGELLGLGITIKAGCYGLKLTRANDVLFCDREYTPAQNEQAEDRPISIEDKAKVLNVTNLVADHPLDRRLFEILSDKTALSDAVVG